MSRSSSAGLSIGSLVHPRQYHQHHGPVKFPQQPIIQAPCVDVVIDSMSYTPENHVRLSADYSVPYMQ